MSAVEADETQSAYGDGGGGPGAPTPLSVLEVRNIIAREEYRALAELQRVSLVYQLEISNL